MVPSSHPGLPSTGSHLRLVHPRLGSTSSHRCRNNVKTIGHLETVASAPKNQTVEVPVAPSEPQALAISDPCDQYVPLLSKYAWDLRTARAVMEAESHCNPVEDNTGLNTDGSNDKGLMQVNSIHVTSGLITDAERFNPESNIRAAYAIYQGAGWKAWSAYNNGAYLDYLK